MAKKLYGAAARAHAKRMSRIKRRRKNPSRKRRARKRRRVSNPRHRKSAKRVAAGKKAARTRKRHAAARRRTRKVHARRAPARRRRSAKRRRTVSVVVNPSRRRRRRRAASHRRNPSRRRRTTHRRRRRNPRPSTQRSMLRARRSIRNKYKSPLARATLRRYRMRSNPGGMFIDTLKQAAPIAVSLYGTRFVSRFVASKVPGLNMVPAVARGPVMAAAMLFGAHFLSKKVSALGKYRNQILLGAGLNLFDQIVTSVGTAAGIDTKSLFGLGEYHSVYGNALSDYIAVGSTPLDDQITLSDYIEVGQLEEELGAMEELGLMEELGEADAAADAATADASNAYLGGVGRGAMVKPIAAQAMVASVPNRSFTRRVPQAGSGYDSPKGLYTGIFAGGFGN